MSARSASLRAYALALLTFASAAPAVGQSLSGSRASLDRQNEVAEEHDFSFLGTSGQVRKFVNAGYLVPVEPNGTFELHQVSYPYARPQVQLFVERLAAQFLAQVDAMAEAARSLALVPNRHEALKRAFRDIYVAELRRSGSTLPEERLHELLAPDVQLNALGLGTWLDKNRV